MRHDRPRGPPRCAPAAAGSAGRGRAVGRQSEGHGLSPAATRRPGAVLRLPLPHPYGAGRRRAGRRAQSLQPRFDVGSRRGRRGQALSSPPTIARALTFVVVCALAVLCVLVPSVPGPSIAADGLHLVLTPSQKPTDLLATGEEFARALTKITGISERVEGHLGSDSVVTVGG